MTTKLQPANLDETLNYSVNQISANTVVAGGVDLFVFANNAYTSANNAGSNDTVVAAFIQANSAYAQANTAQSTAASASSYANAAFITANTAYSWGNHATYGYATQTYVGTQIANLVDSAPVTLDTLNELAYALGNDSNFSTTVATNIGLTHNKANSAYESQNTTGVYANAAFVQANTNATNITAAGSYANSAFLQANAAYAKANTGGAGITYTASNTAPTSPKVGDQWYNVNENILYEYINDGTSNNWVDMSTSPVIPGAGLSGGTGGAGASNARSTINAMIFGG